MFFFVLFWPIYKSYKGEVPDFTVLSPSGELRPSPRLVGRFQPAR